MKIAIIIGITPTDSPTAQFLKNIGYHSFNYSEGVALARHLEDIIIHKKIPRVNNQILENYHVRETMRRLIEQFKSVSRS